MSNRTFRHDCGQEIIVLGSSGGYWRRPTEEQSLRGICGVIPLKGDICTCGTELVTAVTGPESLTEKSEEFTGELFRKEPA